MTATPRLPIWIKLLLWGFGTVGFVSLALATLSMFFWARAPLTRIDANDHCTYIHISEGTLAIKRGFQPFLGYFGTIELFPSFLDGSIYEFDFYDLGEGVWTVEVSLVSVSIVSFVAFSFAAWKASKIRRKATLAALGATSSHAPTL